MSPFVLRPLLSSLPPSSLAVIVPSARRLPSFLRAMALVPLGGRPLAAAAAPPPPPPPVPVDEYFECNMCGDMKLTGCFYWYPGGQKHRSQCTQCDYLWKQIHKEIRRQGCTGFYYTFVKRDDILRRSLFDFFNTHFGPLSGVSIKNWAISRPLAASVPPLAASLACRLNQPLAASAACLSSRPLAVVAAWFKRHWASMAACRRDPQGRETMVLASACVCVR